MKYDQNDEPVFTEREKLAADTIFAVLNDAGEGGLSRKQLLEALDEAGVSRNCFDAAKAYLCKHLAQAGLRPYTFNYQDNRYRLTTDPERINQHRVAVIKELLSKLARLSNGTLGPASQLFPADSSYRRVLLQVERAYDDLKYQKPIELVSSAS